MRKHMIVIAACLALALVAAPSHAMQRPDFIIALGRTVAVNGDPGGGGLSASLSSMWKVEAPLSVGLMVFADDCGSDLGHLYDRNDGVDLGVVTQLHRFAYGAAWRLDTELPGPGLWAPFASATWGAYRVQDDVRGDLRGALSSTGFSVGAGVRRPAAAFGALGLSARWTSIARGPSKGWVSTGLDWQVHWGQKH